VSVRLYGRAAGYGSHAVVTRGFRSVLEKAALLEGFFALDLPEEDSPPPGALAQHGILTGALNMARQMNVGARHDHRWAVVAPNSSYMPPVILKELRDLGVTCLAPSTWAESVLKSYELPTVMVHHGISDEFVQHDRSHAREAYDQEEFTVLHFSTSAGQRKGTLELLQAWRTATELKLLPPKALLVCVLDTPATLTLCERMVDEAMAMPAGVKFTQRFEFAPLPMSAVLAQVNLVCQPSRGEAFGCIPLETRACGVPICATACTGHSDHIWERAPGVVVIPHGADGEIDDGPGALAPTVLPSEIMTALVTAYERWVVLDGEAGAFAPRIRQEWGWGVRLEPFLAQLR
jgi:glycosyltransferase involved in cell wall biosynthesis